MSLFTSFSLTFLKSSPGKLFLTVLGIALGVGMFTAVQLANETALRSFQQSENFLSSDVHRIARSNSRQLPTALYSKFKRSNAIKEVFPFSSAIATLTLKDGLKHRVQLYGIDLLKQSGGIKTRESFDLLQFLRTPNAVLISEPLHSRLQQNTSLSIRSREQDSTLKVLGIIEAGQSHETEYLVTDIGHFQAMTASNGLVDSYHLSPAEGTSVDTLLTTVEGMPADVFIEEEGGAAIQMEKATAAFRLNIQFLALFSLVIAVLLVYNFCSFLVLKRRTQFSVLRSIGVTPRDLLRTVLTEGAALGLTGGLLGFLIGALTADFVSSQVALTVNTLYVPTPSLTVSLEASDFFASILCGTLTGVVGSVLPALEVIRTAPINTVAYQQYEINFQGRTGLLFFIGLTLSALSIVSARPALLEFSILAGFVPPLLFIAGTILCTPKLLALMLQGLRSVTHARELIPLSLAIGHIQSTLRRNAVSIAAVAATLGMVLGVTVMIHSFRGTVKTWIQSVTKADLYISTGGSPARDQGTLSAELLAYAHSLPEVADADVLYARKILFNNTPLEVRGTRFPVLEKYRRLPVTTGSIPKQIDENSNIAFISEAFMRKQSLHVGDRFEIQSPGGALQLQVQGVFEDYSSEHGIVLVSDFFFKRLFSDAEIKGTSLYLKDPGKAASIKQVLLEKFAQAPMTIRNRQELRDYVEEVFNQTFQITYALQIVSTVLAFFIVISTTIMLVLERFDELSMLYSIGAAKKQLRSIIAMESTLLGIFSVLFGVYLGAGLSLFLVFVVNVFFFGWLVSFSLPPLSILALCFAVLIFAFLAGHLTARTFLSTPVLLEERYA